MIDNARNWFVGLSQREKILVGIAGLLLAGLVGFYGIARPMVGAMESAEERYLAAVERQARIDAKVAALRQPVDGTVVRFNRRAGSIWLWNRLSRPLCSAGWRGSNNRELRSNRSASTRWTMARYRRR